MFLTIFFRSFEPIFVIFSRFNALKCVFMRLNSTIYYSPADLPAATPVENAH